VRDRGGEGCDRRDADVRARAGCRTRGREHDYRKPDVSEHETHQPACQGSEKAPDGDSDEGEDVQALEYRAWPIACAA
jgi:hypothetical protein